MSETPEVAKVIPKMQYVFVTLSDGRRGVFVGPELITRDEVVAGSPRLVDVVFSEPREEVTHANDAGTVEQKA
jgi:hypothetical protein